MGLGLAPQPADGRHQTRQVGHRQEVLSLQGGGPPFQVRSVRIDQERPEPVRLPE